MSIKPHVKQREVFKYAILSIKNCRDRIENLSKCINCVSEIIDDYLLKMYEL